MRKSSRPGSCYYSVMMSVFSHIPWLLMIASLSGPGTLSINLRPNFPQDKTLGQHLDTVSLGELSRHWEQYDHKLVRIEAIYSVGPETSEVYDPDCPTSDHTAWVYLWPYGSTSPDPPELQQQLGGLLKQSGRARISVVGRFDGPKQVDIPPDTSPKLADLMRSVNPRCGHQNQWKFQFTFSKIERIEAVPSTEPWPRWGQRPQRRRDPGSAGRPARKNPLSRLRGTFILAGRNFSSENHRFACKGVQPLSRKASNIRSTTS